MYLVIKIRDWGIYSSGNAASCGCRILYTNDDLNYVRYQFRIKPNLALWSSFLYLTLRFQFVWNSLSVNSNRVVRNAHQRGAGHITGIFIISRSCCCVCFINFNIFGLFYGVKRTTRVVTYVTSGGQNVKSFLPTSARSYNLTGIRRSFLCILNLSFVSLLLRFISNYGSNNYIFLLTWSIWYPPRGAMIFYFMSAGAVYYVKEFCLVFFFYGSCGDVRLW